MARKSIMVSDETYKKLTDAKALWESTVGLSVTWDRYFRIALFTGDGRIK